MSDSSSTPPIKQGAGGSLSGFDLITKFSDASLSETDFSIDELLAYLKTFDAQWGPERLRTLQQMIINHTRNFNNPHKDTLAMLADGDLDSLMQTFMPGTVPSLFPLVSFEAGFDLSSPFQPLSVNRDSELNVIDRQGFLKYVGVNNIEVDWSNGFPVLPCWPAISQHIDNADLTSNPNFSFVNTSIAYGNDNGIAPTMFTSQTSVSENASQGQFGFDLAVSYTAHSEYTYSLFMFPHLSLGTLCFKTPAGNIYVDIGTRNILTDSGVKSHVQTFPNGWWRLGIQYIAQNQSETLSVRYYPYSFTDINTANSSNLNYKGTHGRIICSVCCPQVTDGPGLPPFIQGSSLAETTITFPGYDEAMPTTTGMLSLSAKVVSSLIPTTSYPVLNTGGSITITESSSVLSGSIAATSPATPFSSPISPLDDFTTLVISYSASKLITKTNRTPKVTTSLLNTTPLSNISTVTVGPFPGGVCSFSLYAVDDDLDVVSFLTGN